MNVESTADTKKRSRVRSLCLVQWGQSLSDTHDSLSRSLFSFWYQARHHKRVLVPEENKFHSVWLYKMENSCKSVFPNTCEWEQQDWNKTMKQRKKIRRGEWIWKEVQRTRKKSSVQSLSRVVTSVTHDSPSRSPIIPWIIGDAAPG